MDCFDEIIECKKLLYKGDFLFEFGESLNVIYVVCLGLFKFYMLFE